MERSIELENIVVGWFKAAAAGDTSWIDRHVSRRTDVRLVGTDPNEWLQGESVGEFLRAEAQALGGQVQVVPGQVEAYREGTVGWGIIRPTITLPNGQDFSPRWGAVFHQEDGEWKLVQVHASVGVPNEEIMG